MIQRGQTLKNCTQTNKTDLQSEIDCLLMIMVVNGMEFVRMQRAWREDSLKISPQGPKNPFFKKYVKSSNKTGSTFMKIINKLRKVYGKKDKLNIVRFGF